jgi:hypothetical protein
LGWIVWFDPIAPAGTSTKRLAFLLLKVAMLAAGGLLRHRDLRQPAGT